MEFDVNEKWISVEEAARYLVINVVTILGRILKVKDFSI